MPYSMCHILYATIHIPYGNFPTIRGSQNTVQCSKYLAVTRTPKQGPQFTETPMYCLLYVLFEPLTLGANVPRPSHPGEGRGAEPHLRDVTGVDSAPLPGGCFKGTLYVYMYLYVCIRICMYVLVYVCMLYMLCLLCVYVCMQCMYVINVCN